MPGLTALSSKGLLVRSITAAYGEGAFRVMPRSYVLPDQYWRWRAWLKAQVRESDAVIHDTCQHISTEQLLKAMVHVRGRPAQQDALTASCAVGAVYW